MEELLYKAREANEVCMAGSIVAQLKPSPKRSEQSQQSPAVE